MSITKDSKCPLCGNPMTRFGESYSDGDEWIELPIARQQCSNACCGLPVNLWEQIQKLSEAKASVKHGS